MDALAAAEAWLADDPDPVTRAELQALLDAGDDEAIAERFRGRLQFGTAGLRAELGAGPMRMNRVVVRRAAAGLARWLLDTDPAAPQRGVVIGFDARHNSDVFAADSAAVLAGAGIRAHLMPNPVPTPVLAFAVTELRCRGRGDGDGQPQPPARQRLQGVPPGGPPDRVAGRRRDRRPDRRRRADGRHRAGPARRARSSTTSTTRRSGTTSPTPPPCAWCPA